MWSAETARSTYLAAMQANNPQSPLIAYPRTTVVETRVKSVSPVGRNVAMVRFETQRRDLGGQAQPPRAWVALIRYRYSGAPMRLEDRFVNPLGFDVLRYRRDAEALSPEPETSPPEAGQPAIGKPPVQQGPVQQAPPAAAPPPRPAAPEVEL